LVTITICIDFSCEYRLLCTIHATIRRKMINGTHAIILAFAVLINIGVWLFGQLVNVPFEFLSVSYIISGFFILALQLQQEQLVTECLVSQTLVENAHEKNTSIPEDNLRFFESSLLDLTPTEHRIYTAYLEGKTGNEIMEEQNIKRNTLKYHNKNIYSKLGVSSKERTTGNCKRTKSQIKKPANGLCP